MNWKRKVSNRFPRVFWVAIVVLTVRIVRADSLEEFRIANQLYDNGQFADAIAVYEKLEPKSAHVCFNLGNAYYRSDQPGKAVLNYERARSLSPRDPDILANLKFVQQRLAVDTVNVSPQPLRRFLESFTYSRTADEWARHELIFVWLIFVVLTAAVWFPKARASCVVISSVGFFPLLVSAAATFHLVVKDRGAPPAIVLADRVEARFAPLADATVHFKLDAGTRVVVREDRGQWLSVERADGQQGWVKAETIERIKL